MRLFVLTFILFTNYAKAQLVDSFTLNEELSSSTEASARNDLLFLATLKGMEKNAQELGVRFEEFDQKLKAKFREYFERYKERKLVDKFGASYKQTLGENEKNAFLASLLSEERELYIKYSRVFDILKSYSFSGLAQESIGSKRWKAKIDIDIDKVKLEKLFRKIISDEKKSISKVLLLVEIDPYQFTWNDLGLETDKLFLNPIYLAWQKWMSENLPSTVEEVQICDKSCLHFYSNWSASTNSAELSEDYLDAVFVKINFQLKRTAHDDQLLEDRFEWEGRTVLQDVNTKRILSSFSLPPENRTFRQQDLKSINSALASNLYRSPLTAFMQFNRKLEEKLGFNRVSQLVIKGQQHLGDVFALMEMMKTRGSLLGLDVSLDSFSKDQANLVCFYRGEEKSFSDLLSGIKELKSTHRFSLVDEFTGVHYVIKLISE